MNALTTQGIDVWIDVSDIRAGETWWKAIQRGLNECDIMLVLISPDAVSSENVEREWGYHHLAKSKPLIPIRWKPAETPFVLWGLQYVDFHQREFGTAFEELCTELNRYGISIGANAGQVHEIHPSKVSVQSSLPDLESILPPPFEWCYIPEGSVTLQHSYMKASGTINIPEFYIAKYPITNPQYQTFIKDKQGYSRSDWWNYSDSAKDWREQNPDPKEGAFKSIYNHPRVNVTWYEAQAFCNWLSMKLQLPAIHIVLPSEQEWQRAAQGDDDRSFAWGNDFNQSKCNTRENGLRRTTPVDQFSEGASPFGVVDMCGNVWEWCSTILPGHHMDYGVGSDRALRGGSWNFDADSAQVTFRFKDKPYNESFDTGFRICFLPL